MSQAGGERPNPYNTPQQKAAFDRHARQFGRLWLSRRQRQVVPQLLQLLANEPTLDLRERIVIALGRTEDPRALKPLQSLLERARQANQQSGFPWRDQIPPFRLQLALGRIHSRQQRGTAKLNTIAQSLGTNWAGILQIARRLRVQLHDNKTSLAAQESDDRYIVEEFYDVLYRMAKRGENIRQLGAFDAVIWLNETTSVADGVRAQEQGKLFAASLSNRAEIDFWLRRSLPPSTGSLSPGHLLDLGPQVPVVLRSYLQKCLNSVKANPKITVNTAAYTTIFELAAGTGDKRFIPLLREFQTINDPWMEVCAKRAVGNLKSGLGLAGVLFP